MGERKVGMETLGVGFAGAEDGVEGCGWEEVEVVHG